jgi:hypothetical protein
MPETDKPITYRKRPDPIIAMQHTGGKENAKLLAAAFGPTVHVDVLDRAMFKRDDSPLPLKAYVCQDETGYVFWLSGSYFESLYEPQPTQEVTSP